ncbi:MAG: hypothetical protein IIA59_04810 [Candidatus Marinimicrobia bacterium]|nr:hypothetical protein [Candidatus Neomarinimicrobiota bacterium]
MSQPSRLSDFIAELRRRRVFRVAAVYAGVAFVLFHAVGATFELFHIPAWVSSLVIILLLFIAEGRLRRVIRVAVVYAGIAFIIIQIIDGSFEVMGIPPWVSRLLIILLGLGFPVAMGLAWAFGRLVISNRALAIMLVIEFLIAFAFGIWGRWGGDGRDRTSLIRTIAVLPLDNLSGDPEQDYFVDGMQEALTAELSKISALRVIGRTSTMSYKANLKPIPEIAAELNVDAVIEGSVFRAGDRVGIVVMLVATRPERNLWTDSYESDLRDILELHDEVAKAIAAEIKVTFSPEEGGPAAPVSVVHPDAVDALYMGHYKKQKFTIKANEEAKDDYLRAISIDSTYADAYAALAGAYFTLSQSLDHIRSIDGFPLVREYATKAIELDPDNIRGHIMLGWVAFLYDLDWALARRYFDKAEELGNYLGDKFFHSALGQYDKAISHGEEDVRRNPLELGKKTAWAEQYISARQFERAIEICRGVLDTDPDFIRAFVVLRAAYQESGMIQEAAGTYQDSAKRAELVLRVRESGKEGYWLTQLEWAIADSLAGYVHPTRFARLYAWLGQNEKALNWLERGLREHDTRIAFEPLGIEYEGLRDHRRFQRLLEKMNYPSR